MMRFSRNIKRTQSVALAFIIMFWQLSVPLAILLADTQKVSAAPTGTLFPDGQGTYSDWDAGSESDVDETDTPLCTESGGSDGDENISTATTGDRESVIINLSSIANDSTITSIDVSVTYRNGNNAGADDGTFQTFTRLNGTNQDSGTNLVASDTTCTASTQTINVADTLKSGATTLEVGALKTATDTSEVWIGSIRAVVTYIEAPQPDLSVTKTNNVGGSIVNGSNFVWTLTVSNAGSASVSFDNQDILEDDLPNTGATYTLGAVSPSGGVTGTIDCSISSSTLDCDDNNGGSPVIMPAGSSFSVPITVTPTTVGSLVNPRTNDNGNTCKADPDNLKTESNENNNTCANTVSVTNVQPVANPTLPQACGLDIALVIDSSGSIDSGELTQMKNAYHQFVNALLPATPTEFSVTDFGTTASVIQAFSNNATSVNNAIDAPTSGGHTNWQDAFLKGQSTLPNRSNPNLVIFASDGNPNTIGNGPADNAAPDGSPAAMNPAITAANSIKSGGARILAIGIGDNLSLANLQAVSGNNVNTGNVLTSDAITANFDTLSAQLAAFAQQTCGGTITTNKLIDADGNPNTTGDQVPAADWTFDVNGAPSNPVPVLTDAQGKTPAVEVDPGTYSVDENQQPGYGVISASCSGATNNGSLNSNSITGIQVNANDIVSCTFINTLLPGSVKVDKKLDTNGDGSFDMNNPGNFNWSLDGSGTNAMGSTVYGVSAGSHAVSENSVAGYHFVGWYLTSDTSKTCANTLNTTLPANIIVAAGQTTAITLCNARDTGTLRVLKNVDLNGDGDFIDANEIGATNWLWQVNGGANHSSGDAAVVVPTGDYELTETNQANFHQVGLSCVGGTLNGNSVTVAKGSNAVCTFINARDIGLIDFLKIVSGGIASPGDWLFTISGGNGTAVSGDSKSYQTGNYGVTEAGPDGYSATNATGACSLNNGIISLLVNNQGGTCSVTNTRDIGSVKVNKLLDNDGNGSFETANPASFNWSLDGSGNSAMGSSLNSIETGLHTVYENSVAGYHFVGWYQNGTDYNCSNLPQNNKTLPASLIVAKNSTNEITLCNARDTGTIRINKVLSPNSGKFNLEINGTTAGTGSNVGDGGTTGVVSVVTGQYTIGESAGTDTNLANYSISYSCMNGQTVIASGSNTTSSSFDVGSGDDVVCTITNTRLGKIIIEKQTMPNGDAQTFNFNASYNGTGFSLGDDDTNDSGNLLPGTYFVSEDPTLGWDLDSAVCSDRSDPSNISLQAGETVTCTFTNSKRGEVVVTKFNDYNRNGVKDIDEPTLPDWEMNLVSDHEDCEQIPSFTDSLLSITRQYDECDDYEFLSTLVYDHYSYDKSQTTQDDGTTSFESVKPYEPHYLSETLLEDWNWSNTYCEYPEEYDGRGELIEDNNYLLFTGAGETLECFVGNYQEPLLNITKSNNRPNPTTVGDTVTYTLIVDAPKNSGAVYNTVVQDLPPENFEYVPGSWTANSNLRGDIKAVGPTTEPTYGSPGQWILGRMLPGEIVTLTYKAKIATSVITGTYPDIAFAFGCATPVMCTSTGTNSVLANVSTGDDSPFVGTEVTILSPAVIPANTVRLVNTGASEIWRSMIIAGFIILVTLSTFVVSRPQKGGRS